MIRLTDEELQERGRNLLDRFRHVGETTYRDLLADRPPRFISFEVLAPDWPGTGRLARFRYDEWYAALERDWELVKYQYDYRETQSRLAMHYHSLQPAGSTFHAHCEVPLGHPEHSHYRAVPVSLEEARDLFERLFAARQTPDCSQFLPLARVHL